MAKPPKSALAQLLAGRQTAVEELLSEDEDDLFEVAAPALPPATLPRKAPAARPTGPINLGTTSGGEPYRLRLSDQPNQFVCLTGAVGTGKTTLLKTLAAAIAAERVPLIALDFHGDLTVPGVPAERLDAQLGIEPLATSQDPSELLEILRHAAPQLGHLQIELLRRELQQYIATTSRPRMAELQRRLSDLADRATGQERSQAIGVLAALRGVFDAPIFRAPRFLRPAELLQGTRIGMQGLTPAAQRLAAAVILSQIFRTLRQAGPVTRTGALRAFIVLDEAALLRNAPEVETLVREARKFGLGMGIASQQIEDHNPVILANAGTLAVFRTLSRQEAAEIERRTAIPREMVLNLKARGQCVIRTADGQTVVDVQAAEKPGKKAQKR